MKIMQIDTITYSTKELHWTIKTFPHEIPLVKSTENPEEMPLMHSNDTTRTFPSGAEFIELIERQQRAF
jgi:hypothetical protein